MLLSISVILYLNTQKINLEIIKPILYFCFVIICVYILKIISTDIKIDKKNILIRSGIFNKKTIIFPKTCIASVSYTNIFFNIFTITTITFTSSNLTKIKFIGIIPADLIF